MYTAYASWRSPLRQVDGASCNAIDWVEIPHARVVMHTGLSVMYRVAGRDVMLAPLHVGLVSTARQPGDIGTLVLPRWLAHELRLVDRPPETRFLTADRGAAPAASRAGEACR